MLFERSEGVITAIDGEDGRASSAEDAVGEAQWAQVSAEDAIRIAVEGRDGLILGEAELDEDDGFLHWEIELDQAEGGVGDHISVDANTGEIIPG